MNYCVYQSEFYDTHKLGSNIIDSAISRLEYNVMYYRIYNSSHFPIFLCLYLNIKYQNTTVPNVIIRIQRTRVLIFSGYYLDFLRVFIQILIKTYNTHYKIDINIMTQLFMYILFETSEKPGRLYCKLSHRSRLQFIQTQFTSTYNKLFYFYSM